MEPVQSFELIIDSLEKTEKKETVQKNQSEMEMELSLIPDYGEPDYKIFSVIDILINLLFFILKSS